MKTGEIDYEKVFAVSKIISFIRWLVHSIYDHIDGNFNNDYGCYNIQKYREHPETVDCQHERKYSELF